MQHKRTANAGSLHGHRLRTDPGAPPPRARPRCFLQGLVRDPVVLVGNLRCAASHLCPLFDGAAAKLGCEGAPAVLAGRHAA